MHTQDLRLLTHQLEYLLHIRPVGVHRALTGHRVAGEAAGASGAALQRPADKARIKDTQVFLYPRQLLLWLTHVCFLREGLLQP